MTSPNKFKILEWTKTPKQINTQADVYHLINTKKLINGFLTIWDNFQLFNDGSDCLTVYGDWMSLNHIYFNFEFTISMHPQKDE